MATTSITPSGNVAAAVPVILVLLLVGCGGGGSGGIRAGVATFDGVVFAGDIETGGVDELFYTESGGTTPVKVSAPAPFTGVSTFSISPNRRYVAYLADTTIVGSYALYVADAYLNSPVKVSSGNLDVQSFSWAPDSSRVAYIGRNAGVDQLYSVGPTGSGHATVNDGLTPGGDVLSFAWAPDSSLIAYLADRQTDGVNELYTDVPQGGTDTKVNSALAGGNVGSDYAWSPNSSYVAYRAEQDAAGVVELYAYPVGGANAKVNDVLVAGGDVSSFAWAPNSSRLAYLADQDTDGTNELYTDVPAGGSNASVNPALVAGGNVADYEWSPDSSLLAYRADQVTDDVFELWTATPAGASNNRVNPAFAVLATSDVLATFDWAPDSSLLAYRAKQDTASDELYTAAPDGSSPQQVNDAGYIVTNNVGDFFWSPNSARLLYLADYPNHTVNQLYNGAANGSGNVLLNPNTFGGGSKDVLSGGYAWTPDGSQVVYVADQNADDQFELFIVNPDGSGNTRLSGLNPANGDVTAFMVCDSSGVSDLMTP
jgi:Tol biopolymer transport system component